MMFTFHFLRDFLISYYLTLLMRVFAIFAEPPLRVSMFGVDYFEGAGYGLICVCI